MSSKLLAGAFVGVCCSVFSSARCDGRKRCGVSADGLTNYSLEHLPPPSKEELEYVKTWGVSWVDDWDRPRERGIFCDRSSLIKRQIILVRHGQYRNKDIADDSVRCLTPLGEEQARLTGEYLWSLFSQTGIKRDKMLKNEPDGGLGSEDISASFSPSVKRVENYMGGVFVMHEPKFIYVSDMTRAKQTAKLILDCFLPHLRKRLVTDPSLRERYPCDPEPRPRRLSATYEDMRIAESIFERYFHRPVTDESSVEIIIGHSNVFRYLVCRALQLPPEAWLRISLPHCSITSITISGKGHVRLSTLGSAGHLPVDMVTTHNVN